MSTDHACFVQAISRMRLVLLVLCLAIVSAAWAARTVQVGTIAGTPGGTVAVPVQLVAQGNESGVGFSLSFDPTILSNPVITIPGGLMPMTNDTQKLDGRLGIMVSQYPGNSFAAGTHQIALVTFNVVASPGVASTPITFINTPTTCEVSDANALSLTAAWTNGAVTFSLPPAATNDAYSTPKNVPLTVAAPGVLANDTDPGGQPLTAVKVSDPGHGAVTLNANGSFTYTPTTDYIGPDSFTYKANNGTTDSNIATVNLTVSAPQRTVRVVSVTGTAGGTVAVPVQLVAQGNESGVGFSLSFDPTILSNPVITIPGGLMPMTNDTQKLDGRLGIMVSQYPGNSFAAGTHQIALVTFNVVASPGVASTPITFINTPTTCEVSDANALPLTAIWENGTVTFHLPPVAVNDSYTRNQDAPLTVAAPGVLANDSDPHGQPLTPVKVSDPAHGTVILNADGSFTYTPTPGYNGSDSFTYKVNNGTEDSAVATVTINVNGAPTATGESYVTDKNVPLTVAAPGVLANDSDPNGDALTAVKVSDPAHGTVTLNADGSFTYTPAAGYVGPDSFTYKASDGVLESGVVTVTLKVNGAPEAVGESYVVDRNGTFSEDVPGVLGNDTDPNGDALTAIKVSDPGHGTVTLNADGSFTYTPTAGYTGTDSFTYKANDGRLDSNVVTVSFKVNAPPVAVANAYVTNMNVPLVVPAPGVLGNDTDADGDALTAIKVGDPAHGSLALSSDGSFTYNPTSGYVGPDSFSYKAFDGRLESNVVTVTITVNGAPTANNDSYSTQKDAPLTIAAPGVLANDTDPNADPLTAIKVSGPGHGTVTLNADGSFTYTPTAGYAGFDSFTYKVNDGRLDSNVATVSLKVIGVPVAVNDTYVTNMNATLTVTTPGVLGNDTDPTGSALTAIKVSDPAHGAVTFNADGSFTYTPNTNYDGPDSFTYKVSNGTFESTAATVQITVSGAHSLVRVVSVTGTAGGTVVVPVELQAMGDENALSFSLNFDPAVLSNPVVDLGIDAADGWMVVNDADVEEGRLGVLFMLDAGAAFPPGDCEVVTVTFTIAASPGVVNTPITFGDVPIERDVADFDAMSVLPLWEDGVVTINMPPAAVDDTYSTNQDTPLTVPAPGVLANDSDSDGNPLTAVIISGVSHGTLALNTDGSFTYTPTSGWTGTDSFTYAANDGRANSNTATVTIRVYARPTAVNDSYVTDKNTPLTVAAPGVLANDSDPDGDPLTAVKVSEPANGTVTLNADGSFTYTPAAGFIGVDSFTYQAYDGRMNSNVATVTIRVNGAPVAMGDNYVTDMDVPLTVAAPGVLGNDTDPNGDPITAVKVSDPAHGTLALNADGSFTYTPAAGFVGTDSFTYKANDSRLDSNVVTVTITVNGAPVAVNDSYVTDQDVPLTIAAPGVMGNDTDPNGDALTAVKVSDPAHGALTLNADGSFTYTPVSGYVGMDSFTYKVTDGRLESNTATVTIKVNGAPVATGESYVTDVDVPLTVAAPGVLGNDTDPNGDPLTAVKVTNPAHGTVTLNADGSFTYTPTAGYAGPDSFTYKANDGRLDSNVVTVTITVNGAPVAANDSYVTDKNVALTVAAPGVLANDSDPNGDTFTAVKVGDPAHGTVTLNADGSFTYTPATDYVGMDSFTYKLTDGRLESNTATVTIKVNGAPTAIADSYVTDVDVPLTVAAPGVLENDTDPNSDTLTAIKVTDPAHGTLTLNANGSFTYTPTAGYAGPDSFTYKANDGRLDSNVVAVTIKVNGTPVAANDSYVTDQDLPLNIAAPGVLGNDSDPDNDPLTAVKVADPGHGTLTLNADGSFTYTPTAGYSGPDSFTYRANDGRLSSNVATVSIMVNGAPVAADDNYVTDKDVALTVTAPGVLGNDVDANGDPLTAVKVSDPANGTVTLNADGSFTYTPNAGYVGMDSFTYKATDGRSDSNTATVTIKVNGAPVAAGDSYVTDMNVPLTISAPGVLGNDTDPNSDPLTAVKVSDPAHGTVTLNANGSFTYTPAAGYIGTDSFTYKVTDGRLDSNTVTVTIKVNGAPVAADDNYVTDVGVALTISAPGVLGNDTDPNGDALTAVKISDPAHGTVTLNADGSFTYTPDAGYAGLDSFTYRASDGRLNSNTATVQIKVNGAPVATGESYIVDKDTVLTVAAPGVLGNDTDPNGDALTAVKVTDPTHGTLVLNADGSFTYTPAAGYSGTDSFTYKATDGRLDSAIVTVNIKVNAPPVAVADAYTLNEDTVLTVPAPGVLGNDSDLDGDAITAVKVSDPSSGALTFNADGSLTYTPAHNFVGTDSFTYHVFDGRLYSETVTVTITVTPTGFEGDVAPRPDGDGRLVAADWSQAGRYASGLDTPAAGSEFMRADTAPRDVLGDGVLTTADWVQTGRYVAGLDPRVAPGGPSSQAAPIPAPTAKSPALASASLTEIAAVPTDTLTVVGTTINRGQSGTVYIDLDAQGTESALGFSVQFDPALLTYTGATLGNGAKGATWIINTNDIAAGRIGVLMGMSLPKTFSAGTNRILQITFTASTGAGSVNTPITFVNQPVLCQTADTSASVIATTYVGGTVLVQGPNQAPVASNGSLTILEDHAGTGQLSATDPDGDQVFFTLVANGTKGTAAVNANGSYTYTPLPDANGTDSFTFQANDGLADSNVATVTVNITPVNDAPVAQDASVSTGSNVPVGGQLVATDVDGDTLAYRKGASPQHGAVVVNADGTFLYTPSVDYTGTDSFTFIANDGQLDSNDALIAITVNGTSNTPPVAVNETFLVARNTPLAIPAPGVLANDVDAELDALTAVIVSQPSQGTLALQADGSFTYQPSAGYTGIDQFRYRASDGKSLSNIATVTLSVQASEVVSIDIRPGVTPNVITLGAEEDLPVAIFSTAIFDATKLDVASLRLAGAPIRQVSSGKGKGNLTYRTEMRDLNGDGRNDLLAYFVNEQLQLTRHSLVAYLQGKLKGKVTLFGVDLVSVK